MKRLVVILLFAVLAFPSAAEGTAGPDEIAEAFAAAFSSGQFERVQSFYERHTTQDFRDRSTVDRDRNLYGKLHGDMGAIRIQTIDLEGPARMVLVVSTERIPDPVTFAFAMRDGKIDGFTVEIGGPPPGSAAGETALDLPSGADEARVSAALDSALKGLTARDEFSGVVLVARNGEPVFHRAYGMADREAARANTVDTRFDIGSITKLLTKIGIGQLAQAGRLSLDDTLAELLPDYPNQEIARRITIEQLLEHSSGLGDIFNDRWDAYPKSKLVAPRDFFPLFADKPLLFEPGQGNSYSNAGYVVLGAVIEKLSGKPYAKQLERKIFKPAGMSRSGFALYDGSNPAMAVGYTRQGSDGGALERNLGMLPPRGCAAGSSAHSALDLLKLDQALRSGKLLGAGWTEWVFGGSAPTGADVPVKRPIQGGLGVAGGGAGVNAVYAGDQNVLVVVLSNLDPPSAEALHRQILRSFEAVP